MRTIDHFFVPKWVKILSFLGTSIKKVVYVTDIQKTVGLSPSYVINSIHMLEKEGIIKSKRKGRTKAIKLTNKGAAVYDAVKELEKQLLRGRK